MRGGATARSMLLLLAGLLLAGEAAGLAAQFDRDLPAFIIVALLQGAVWAVAAAIVTRGAASGPALALILATAILLRLVALAAPVFFSDDIIRYIWDGRVQAAGINPYRYVPNDPGSRRAAGRGDLSGTSTAAITRRRSIRRSRRCCFCWRTALARACWR